MANLEYEVADIAQHFAATMIVSYQEQYPHCAFYPEALISNRQAMFAIDYYLGCVYKYYEEEYPDKEEFMRVKREQYSREVKDMIVLHCVLMITENILYLPVEKLNDDIRHFTNLEFRLEQIKLFESKRDTWLLSEKWINED